MKKNKADRCKMMEHCLFFNEKMAKMPRSAQLMKEMFCTGEYEKCARHVVSERCGSDRVPIDLFPSEFRRARKIVSECGE